MKVLFLMLFVGVLFVVMVGVVQVQSIFGLGFYGVIGYYYVNFKSGNGMLVGVFCSDINSDFEFILILGYNFDSNWSVEVWLLLIKFKYDVSLDGVKLVSIKYMLYLFMVQYYFLFDSVFCLFIGVGYGFVNVSGECIIGLIIGILFNVKSGDGFVGQFGVDYYVIDNVFICVDVCYFDWKSKVEFNGVGIGEVKVNLWIYGVSVGYCF